MSKTASYFKPFHELASIFHSPFLPFQGSDSCKTAMIPAIILFYFIFSPVWFQYPLGKVKKYYFTCANSISNSDFCEQNTVKKYL